MGKIKKKVHRRSFKKIFSEHQKHMMDNVRSDEVGRENAAPVPDEVLIASPAATRKPRGRRGAFCLDACRLEKNLCRCCHSQGPFICLHEWYTLDSQEIENRSDAASVAYSDMLRECLDIELTSVIEPLKHTLCSICHVCIKRLRDAADFKHQVRECETRFRQLYWKEISEDFDYVSVKQEKPDPEVEDIPTQSKLQAETNENTVTSKVKQEKKVSANKKATPPKKQNVGNTVQGVIEVKKCKPLVLKEGVDYKRDGDEFRCCKCGTTKSRKTIRSHIKKVHLKIPPYSCSHCCKSFPTRVRLVRHKLQAHGVDDRHECNACHKYFSLKSQFVAHMAGFHMMGEKYKCDTCHFETFVQSSYYKHKLVHKNVKDFRCEFCQKTFKRLSTLRLHERIHTGDKRKVCQVCGQAFVQKASLNYHMTKHHPEVNF